MTIPSTSDAAQYRITFFFGPEVAHDPPHHVRCVFNVKKRSWKGGVQVAINLDQDRLLQARERLGYGAWLGKLLQRIEPGDREAIACRADDLFIQVLSSFALTFALRAGIEQENQIIDAERFGLDLDRLVNEQSEQLMEQIRLQLDVDGSPDQCLMKSPHGAKLEGV